MFHSASLSHSARDAASSSAAVNCCATVHWGRAITFLAMIKFPILVVLFNVLITEQDKALIALISPSGVKKIEGTANDHSNTGNPSSNAARGTNICARISLFPSDGTTLHLASL
jgi:hypothetical protein